MKLIYCCKCHDVVSLFFETRRCRCGDVYGKYTDNRNAIVSTRAIPLGIYNNSLVTAVKNRNSFLYSDTSIYAFVFNGIDHPTIEVRDYELECLNTIAEERLV